MFFRRMKKIKLIFSITTVLILLFGCSTVNDPGENAPTIPPESTMTLNISDFPDTTTSALYKEVASYEHWGWAALNVHYWNSVITVTLSIPIAAFAESFNHQPVLQSDGSWLWTYQVTVGANIYTAKLYGKPIETGVEWRMLLTKTGSYSNFEWFTGFSNLPATEGTWTLNKNPNEPQPFIGIDWSRDVEANTADVKYTNIIPGNPENGAYIHYGKTNDSLYNRYYRIWSEQNLNLTDIVWNFENHNGSVNDPQHFGSPDWYCWDENLLDADCP